MVNKVQEGLAPESRQAISIMFEESVNDIWSYTIYIYNNTLKGTILFMFIV